MKHEFKTLTDIRHKVFTAVSKVAFDGNPHDIVNRKL